MRHSVAAAADTARGTTERKPGRSQHQECSCSLSLEDGRHLNSWEPFHNSRQALRCALCTQTGQCQSRLNTTGTGRGKEAQERPKWTMMGSDQDGAPGRRWEGAGMRPGVCDAGNSTGFRQSKSLFCFLYGPAAAGSPGVSPAGLGLTEHGAVSHNKGVSRTRTRAPSPQVCPRPQGTEAGKGSATALVTPRGAEPDSKARGPASSVPPEGDTQVKQVPPCALSRKEQKRTGSIAYFISIEEKGLNSKLGNRKDYPISLGA